MAAPHLPRLCLAAVYTLASSWGLAPARGQDTAPQTIAAPFVHPGLLQSAADLDRMRQNVKDGVEPWAGAWKAFTTGNKWIAPDYKPRPLEIVGRGVGATGQGNISNDCTAAYYNAIAWVVTGNEAYAKKSIEIMNAWSYKCREINGKDAVLCAGIYGYKLLNAAEIIRSTYPQWSTRDIDQFRHLARDVFYPVVKDFATFANGNWDASAEAAMISIAIFLDDRPMFDRAVRYYLAGSGDGSILHYIINDSGQLQETGRDQGHAQLGIGLLSCVAEMAWHQGVDLYGADDNRLLKGFEYTAKYNLGEDVPFEPTTDRTGKYVHARTSPRRRPTMQIYEMVYNHYVNRIGIPAPYTGRAAALQRPESLAIDQVGAGTLLFSLPPFHPTSSIAAPATSGTLLAVGTDNGIDLSWPSSVGASSYTLRRAAAPTGPYEVIAKGIHAFSWRDTPPKHHVFYYMLTAINALGAAPPTRPVGAAADLPAPWKPQDIGDVAVPGHTAFDGGTFTLEAAGAGIEGAADHFHLAAAPLSGDGTLVARYVPQTPSQFAQMGIMMRDSANPGSPFVALLLTPEATNDIEVPHWHAELLTRQTADGDCQIAVKGLALDAPTVTWGRLMGPLWLRITRSANSFNAAISVDGRAWSSLGTATLPLQPTLDAGLAACSRIKGSTTVMFDHVAVGPSSAVNGDGR